ncbi:required for meiotic nuclear division protein 1 homolog [Neodiprion lecontei]|uniref:Required for meiotic nuclear division protein 1 homolog n=1 Tax=Neodiprion lecontei TaxID=441921 RepID=A0A6J0BC82_NEOLC|nr:required for meiotic nuclear division protein 1 homolog [Neodiprion lecontei]
MLFATFQRLTLSRIGMSMINGKGFCSLSATIIKLPEKKFTLKLGQLLLFDKYKFVTKNSIASRPQRFIFTTSSKLHGVQGIQQNVSTFQMKKRPLRKKRSISEDEESSMPGFWNVKSLATADEYDLEGLMDGLLKQDLYLPQKISTSSESMPDVIHAVAKYEVETEPREVYFFREGTVVFWNMSELESGNLLRFLKSYEQHSYADKLVQSESELMLYTHLESSKKSHLKEGNIMLAPNATDLDKYTFSNAIALSVKLGIWEASLDRYVDSIAFVTDDLKSGRPIKMSREEVLRKQGELFALRHMINLSSDLLDTPDFYWERDELENLFQQTCSYFSIAKRTRVMNEKLNHCVELVELLSSHLSDRHHVRLEWMIIVLIMVEVVFEILHYIDRYFADQPQTSEVLTS